MNAAAIFFLAGGASLYLYCVIVQRNGPPSPDARQPAFIKRGNRLQYEWCSWQRPLGLIMWGCGLVLLVIDAAT